MSIEEGKRQLALHRIQQAEESLDEARYLLAGNKSPRSVINRAYYSMFYSILALLIFEPYSSSKHSGVLSYFNRHFIKNGMIAKDIGRAVNKAFDIRQRGDYRDNTSYADIIVGALHVGRCIEKCPPKALYEQPIKNENGLLTHNDSTKCFPYFAANYGCSICIKVCPFSTTGYEKIKAIVMKRKKN